MGALERKPGDSGVIEARCRSERRKRVACVARSPVNRIEAPAMRIRVTAGAGGRHRAEVKAGDAGWPGDESRCGARTVCFAVTRDAGDRTMRPFQGIPRRSVAHGVHRRRSKRPCRMARRARRRRHARRTPIVWIHVALRAGRFGRTKRHAGAAERHGVRREWAEPRSRRAMTGRAGHGRVRAVERKPHRRVSRDSVARRAPAFDGMTSAARAAVRARRQLPAVRVVVAIGALA